MKSAYFGLSEEHLLDDIVNFSSTVAESSPSWFGSPLTSAPFWNRQCIGFATDLKASCAASPIVLSSSDIHLILSSLAACGGQPACTVQLTQIAASSDIALSYSARTCYTLTTAVESRVSRLSLSVPVSFDTCLPSDAGAYRLLMENLWKALRGGSRFAMRSCCRLRASGSGARTTALDGSESLAGTVRFEALVPDVSFRASQISPIPILATPLTKLLTNPNQPLVDVSMGYIAMNRTRKLVFANETDASVPLVPTVGVWVQLPGLADVHHPFVWAACARYLCADIVQRRVFVDGDKFLLVLLHADRVEFFEMSLLPRADDGHGADTALEDLFLCSDFTVDLSIDIDRQGQCQCDPVLCRFRAVERGVSHSGFAPSTSPEVHGVRASSVCLPKAQRSSVRALSPTTANPPLLRAEQSERSVQREVRVEMSGPRTTCPLPLQPPVSPAKTQGHLTGEAAAVPAEAFVTKTLRDVDSKYVQAGATFAESGAAHTQIILSQQRELDALRAEVRALQLVVRRLSGQEQGKGQHERTEEKKDRFLEGGAFSGGESAVEASHPGGSTETEVWHSHVGSGVGASPLSGGDDDDADHVFRGVALLSDDVAAGGGGKGVEGTGGSGCGRRSPSSSALPLTSGQPVVAFLPLVSGSDDAAHMHTAAHLSSDGAVRSTALDHRSNSSSGSEGEGGSRGRVRGVTAGAPRRVPLGPVRSSLSSTGGSRRGGALASGHTRSSADRPSLLRYYAEDEASTFVESSSIARIQAKYW